MKENCAIKIEGAGYGIILSSDENKLFGGRMGKMMLKNLNDFLIYKVYANKIEKWL